MSTDVLGGLQDVSECSDRHFNYKGRYLETLADWFFNYYGRYLETLTDGFFNY